MSKHTKGEWKVSGTSRSMQRFHVAANGENVCAVFTSIPEAEANAKLIAAAPDLLEALQEILKEFEDKRVQMNTPIAYFKAFNKGEEAIKKATL